MVQGIVVDMLYSLAADLPAHIDTYTLTNEQEGIVTAARERKNIVVQAGAGTGKTTTMGFIAEVCAREGRRVYYTAYNKSIAEDVQASFSPCANSTTKISTVHALCLRTLNAVEELRPLYAKFRRLHSPDAQVPRNAEIVKLMRDQAPAKFYYRSLRNRKKHGARSDYAYFTPRRLVGLALDVVQNYCHSDAEVIGPEHVEIPRPMEVFSSSATFDEDVATQQAFVALMVRTADTLWSMICDPEVDVLLDHDHYLKIVSNHDCDPFAALGMPYDTCIMFDEAQDARPAMTRIIKRVMAQPFTQYTVVVVGDSSQAIYGSFTGAVDALPVFEDVLDNCYVGTLTYTRRFGELLTEIPNMVLDVLDAPIRLRGSAEMDSEYLFVLPHEEDEELNGAADMAVLDHLSVGCAVLVRTNAQALMAANEAAKKGFSVASTVDVSFIRSVVDDYYAIMTGDWSRKNAALYDIKDAQDLADLMDSVDEGFVDPQYREFIALFRMIQYGGTEAVLNGINCLSDKADADVFVTTVHKAKGQQWDDVVLFMGTRFVFPNVEALSLPEYVQKMIDNDVKLTEQAQEAIDARHECGEYLFGATWQKYLDTVVVGEPDTTVLDLSFHVREELMVLYVALTRPRQQMVLAESFHGRMLLFLQWWEKVRNGEVVV